MKFDIKNRFTGKIQFSAEIDCAEDAELSIKIGLTVKWAITAGANLAGANLAGADLAGADLAGAYLAGADLAGANLARAYLAGADLAGAYLARANLAGADLARANLAGAYLAKQLTIAPEDIPVIPNIDAAILAAIEAGGTLAMNDWHTCETTHCRAGWAIHLAGEKGTALEDRLGSHIAGTLIYQASRPGIPAPWFFAPNEKAMADIRKCAEEQTAAISRAEGREPQ